MYKVIILPSAKLDVAEIADWYNRRKKGLGKRFTSKIRKKIKFIKKNPFGVNIKYDDVRTAPIEIFPYMIHYSIDEDQKVILISSILSTDRNPRIWEDDN